jgi:DNA processing protein
MTEPASLSKSERERLSALKLSLVPELGPRTFHALLERFGCAANVLAASTADLAQVPRVTKERARLIQAARDSALADEELALCNTHRVRLIVTADASYPRLLREIHDPPPVLYVRGELKASDGLAIAMVGARRASVYGRQQAERLAAALAGMGFTIVSGLARGIDAAAHRGALAAGGRTIAVLAGGLANIYPPEHQELAEQVAACGAVISEVSMRQEPLPTLFPRRNRIISGLSLGVLVVEAGLRSGALITARHAGEQGREVFAVPGRIDSLGSQGAHKLIQDGAHLVGCVQDIVEQLGPLVEAAPRPEGPAKNRTATEAPDGGAALVRHPAELMLNDIQRRVLDQIPADPTSTETVIAASGLPAAQVIAVLSHLELRHLIHRLPGNQYCRA